MNQSSDNAYCNPDHLLRMARAGESDALDRMTQCYGARLLQASQRYCRTATEAEDAVQDTWIIAQEKLSGFRGEGSLEGWLVRIVAHSCRRLARGRKNEDAQHSIVDELPNDDPSPLDLSCQGQTGRIISRELLSLSPTDRSVLLLVEMEGWKSVEVAAEIGLSAEAVRTRLSRMKARLRRTLLQDYPEISSPDV